MLYYINKKYFFLLAIITVLYGQTKKSKSYFQSDKYVLGGFINANDGGLDFEFLANAESEYGIYSNIWLSQIDYYSNTDVQSNISLGYNKKFDTRLSLDFGYAYNYSFSDDPEEVTELYLGIDIKNISVWTYIGSNGISFESWYKPDIVELNKSNLDLLFYGYIEENGYDISINFSSQLTRQIITGVMLGYERYSEKKEIIFNKNNKMKSFSYTENYSDVSSMIYLGFLLNN